MTLIVAKHKLRRLMDQVVAKEKWHKNELKKNTQDLNCGQA